MSKPVDYDAVAPTYNARYRGSEPPGLAAALEGLVDGAARVLEVGCGTGHWVAAMAPRVAQMVGLDRSAGMLEKARAGGAGILVRGEAGALPFPSACFDALFCVNAIHHFPDAEAFVREVARVVRPGGRAAVIGMDTKARLDRWYLYDYFPGTFETDERRYPPAATVGQWLAREGFESIECGIASRIQAMPEGREVYTDPILSRHGTSQFSLLSDAEFEAGMARIEAAIVAAEKSSETIVFPVDIHFGMAMGTRSRG